MSQGYPPGGYGPYQGAPPPKKKSNALLYVLIGGGVGVFGLLALCGIAGSKRGADERRAAAAPASASASATVDPYRLPPADAFAAIAKAAFTDRLKVAHTFDMNASQFERLAAHKEKADAAAHPGDKITHYGSVSFKMRTGLSANYTVRGSFDDCLSFAQKAFKIPTLDRLECLALGEFTDAYGKDSEDTATKLTMSRSTAEKIEWKNFQLKNLRRVMAANDDGFYVHPALKSHWDEIEAD